MISVIVFTEITQEEEKVLGKVRASMNSVCGLLSLKNAKKKIARSGYVC